MEFVFSEIESGEFGKRLDLLEGVIRMGLCIPCLDLWDLMQRIDERQVEPFRCGQGGL